MSSEMTNGFSKADIVKLVGQGALAVVMVWLFISYTREVGVRQDAQSAESRHQLELLVERETTAIQSHALAMEKLAIAVERVNVSVDGISKSGFGQILGAINKATEATKQVADGFKPEGKP